MYIPKKYGQSKVEKCPFCDQQGTSMNRQGIPVCKAHKESELKDMKCACGDYLDIRQGKFGAFFTCMKCGAMNLRKALEINTGGRNAKTQSAKQPSYGPITGYKTQSTKEYKPAEKPKPKEIVIRSDDPYYFS